MSVEIKLEYPIDDGGQKVEKLTIRRPTVLDLMVMDGVEGNIAKTVRMISQLCDLPIEVIQTLDVSDYNKASDKVVGFLE